MASLSLATVGSLLGLAGWLLFLYDEESRLAPDSLYYQALRRRELVPMPFCLRWFGPFVMVHQDLWKLWAGVACVMTTSIACQAYGVAGALLWLGLPAGPRFWARHPVLVDPLAALALWLFVVAPASFDGPGFWFRAFLLGGFREQLPLLATLMHADPRWLVGYVGTAVGWVLCRRAAASYDNSWIRAPWTTTLQARRGSLLNPLLLVLPWGVVLPVALLAWPLWTWQTFAVLAVGYLPILRSSDTARCYLWAAPVLIALAVQAPVPAMLWPVLLLLHWSNPYRGA